MRDDRPRRLERRVRSSALGTAEIDVISRGEGFGVDATGKFAYLDTQADLGMILEVVEPPTSLGEPLRRL